MQTLVLVAEPCEIELVPLAYKACPVLVTGVGEAAIVALSCINPWEVRTIVNVGYCGAPGLKVGEAVDDHVAMDVVTSDSFAENADDPHAVYDMELARIRKWCERYDVELRYFKVVSDNCNYKQYKEAIK